MDDFIDRLKEYGSTIWNKSKDLFQQHKGLLKDAFINSLDLYKPGMGRLADQAFTVFGG